MLCNEMPGGGARLLAPTESVRWRDDSFRGHMACDSHARDYLVRCASVKIGLSLSDFTLDGGPADLPRSWRSRSISRPVGANRVRASWWVVAASARLCEWLRSMPMPATFRAAIWTSCGTSSASCANTAAL